MNPRKRFHSFLTVGAAFLLACGASGADLTWPQPKEAGKIVQDRFANASTNALGSANDITAVKQAITEHLRPQKGEVHELRWLSASLVMAHTHTVHADFYYVAEKKKGNWSILTYYLLWKHTSFAGPFRFSTNRVTVIFETRYYVSYHPDSDRPSGTVGAFPKHLSVLQNSGTNFKCSVEAPYRLSQGTNGLSPYDVTGFVMQIVEPPKYAGQVLTARTDGYVASGDPFTGLALGTRYQATIDVAAIGHLGGGLGY